MNGIALNHYLLTGSLAGCGLLMLFERAFPTTLRLALKGDFKREGAWLGQYGQVVCTVAAAGFVWQIGPDDAHRIRNAVSLVAAVGATALTVLVLKRLIGRVRPNRPNAGAFLGPCWRHDAHRESFPSSHTACAVALTVGLANLFPEVSFTLWTLALLCAALRYLTDAHWPSDILGGIAVGYVVAHFVFRAVHAHL